MDCYLYVGNLSYDANEKMLKDTFSKTGNVQEVKIAKSDKGIFMGYAFIKMKTSQEVDKSIQQLNQTEISESAAPRKMVLKYLKDVPDLWENAFGPFTS